MPSTALTRRLEMKELPSGIKVSGTSLLVDDGVVVEGCVELAPTVASIKLGAGARLCILDGHVGAREIEVGKGAHLDHVIVPSHIASQDVNAAALVVVADDGHYSNFTLHDGACLVGNSIDVTLGHHAKTDLGGVVMAGGKQRPRTEIIIKHAGEGGRSGQLYRTVVNGAACATFHGKVIVQKGAQKTDAQQLHKAILLSNSAQSDSKPELEIYADDVKCSHGATVGELDDAAMFYLCSRGLSPDAARQLLVTAFLSEVLEKIENGGARELCAVRVEQWLAVVEAEDKRG